MITKILSDNLTYSQVNSENPKICFLHGWGGESSNWKNISGEFESIALDIPGFGKSVPFEKSFSPKISISNEHTRNYLNGIFLHLTQANGRCFLTGVATDSHRLSSSSLEIESVTDFTSLILPRKTVFQLCSILTETSDQLVMQTSENKIKFVLGNMKLISKVIDGKFPDYKKVVPTENNKTLLVSSKDFINSIN